MQVKIKRFEHDENEGTRGVILINDEFFGYSIEQGNNHNTPFKSRIPAGTYACNRDITTNHGERFFVISVPNRYGIILFHKGNTKLNLAGCIGAGDGMGLLNDSRAVWNTNITCNAFMTLMEGTNILTLIIEDV